ncbi:MAG: hypothetical protein LC659_15600, partial [Myxococcales bacterium]|nr:hypothetical protein [Myxococcales bacterium]
MATRASAVACLLLLPILGACRRQRGWKEETGPVAATWKPTPRAVSGVPAEAVRAALQGQLAAPRPRGLGAAQWKRVHDLYAAYGGTPLWLEEDGSRDRARALVSELAKAPTHGLRLGDYPLAELRDALAAVHDAKSPSAEQLAVADVLLSAAYVAHAQNLLVGQVDPRTVSQGWHIDPQKVDVDSALAQRLTLEPLDRAIAQLRPEDADYDSLRIQLDRYREINALGGWPRVPEGKSLRPRDTTSAERLGKLAARLAIEGYLADSSLTSARADSAAPKAARAIYD